MKFEEFLKEKEIVLLDGAIGTELQKRGFNTALPLWSGEASLLAPKLLEEIHRDYVKAGADIISTNTFRTTRWTFKKVKKEKLAEKATISAIKIAKKVKKSSEREVFVAGDLAPLEDCYRPDLVPENKILEREHKRQIELLASLGVDLFLIETINCQREAKVLLRLTKETKKPTLISFCINKNLELLSGEKLENVIEEIKKYSPSVILLNCISLSLASKGLKKLREIYSGFIGAYAQGEGVPEEGSGWKFNKSMNSVLYLKEVKKWLKYSPKIIGGCCGTTPEYIRLMSDLISPKVTKSLTG